MSFSHPFNPCIRCCGEYECFYCPDLKFPNSFALIKHLRKSLAHKEHDDEAFWCAFCNETFPDKVGYINHLKHKRIHKYDLHQAACCGRFADVGQLIHTEDADVTGASHKLKPGNSASQLGMTPMHCAAFKGYSSCLKVMLSWPDGNPNKPDELGQTAVHLAARCGRASSLSLLLKQGGKLNIMDKQGKNPIQLAHDDDDCMNVILNYQLSTMISKYRLREEMKAKRSVSFVEEKSCVEEDPVDSSESESSLSETEECSEDSGNLPTKFPQSEQGAVCPDMISKFQDVEKFSKGNLATICAPLKDDDKTGQEIVSTNKIKTDCQDFGKFSKVSSEMLPYEILARGEDAVSAFKSAVAEGTAPASRLKIIVVGEVGAGKTSLTRSLCGQPFVDAREKTRGIQTASISEPIVQTTKLDDSWKHADPGLSHYDELIAGNVTKKLRKKIQRTAVPGLPSLSGGFDLSQILERLAVTSFPGLQTPSRPIPGSQESVVVTEPSVAIAGSPRKLPATLIAEKLSRSTTELSSVKKIIWDFAGHQLYEPMHHVFMNSTSLYLVVFNLLKMSASPEKSLCKIQYWLNSIASHTLASTPVILVGTHKQMVSSEFIETAKEYCEKKFANIFSERLVRSLDGEILFAVENSEGPRDDGIVRLKNAIANDIFDSKNFWFVNQELPLKWLHCEEEIIEHQKNPDSKKCLDVNEVRTLLEDKCQAPFTDPEFSSMLAFFHDIGLILLPGNMHDINDESLGKDLVILSPQYLVDIMTHIHEVPKCRDFKRQFSNEFKKLQDEGRVGCKLLEHVWKNKTEQVDVLLELLSRFKLLYPLHTESEDEPKETVGTTAIGIPIKEYIVPCMLKQKSSESLNRRWLRTCGNWKNISDTEHQFVFDFGCFLPPPLFDYLLVHVYRHSCKTKGMSPILQRRGGIFSFSDKFLFCTKLVVKDCQIWVYARCKKGEHFLHLARILRKKVSEICRQFFKFVKFICGPPCPREDCPGATFNEVDIQRPCESSSSGSDKSSESGDDDQQSCAKVEVAKPDKGDDKNELRSHVISIDPESFDPPYWCRSVNLSECLKDWNPEFIAIHQDQGLKDEDVADACNFRACCVKECCITIVSEKLGKTWKTLGRKLDVEDTKIENISSENPEQIEQGFQVVSVWKKRLGNAANAEVLINALETISRKDIADKLVRHCQESHFSKK